MDDGLREAIARASGNAKRPLAIEQMIDMARRYQGLARQAQADPAAAKRLMKDALNFGRDAARLLPPGGELRRHLESGELMSEEEWERLCGPRLPPGELGPLQP
jgi:hypothetical protein